METGFDNVTHHLLDKFVYRYNVTDVMIGEEDKTVRACSGRESPSPRGTYPK